MIKSSLSKRRMRLKESYLSRHVRVTKRKESQVAITLRVGVWQAGKGAQLKETAGRNAMVQLARSWLS